MLGIITALLHTNVRRWLAFLKFLLTDLTFFPCGSAVFSPHNYSAHTTQWSQSWELSIFSGLRSLNGLQVPHDLSDFIYYCLLGFPLAVPSAYNTPLRYSLGSLPLLPIFTQLSILLNTPGCLTHSLVPPVFYLT